MHPRFLQSHGALSVRQVLPWRSLLSGHKREPQLKSHQEHANILYILIYQSMTHCWLPKIPCHAFRNPYWRGARQWWGQLASLEGLSSWPITRRRRFTKFAAGIHCSPSPRVFTFYFDTNACHVDIPTGVNVKCWRAGLNHSVERQKKYTILAVIWVWWGLGTG